jgi:hypothetical protein
MEILSIKGFSPMKVAPKKGGAKEKSLYSSLTSDLSEVKKKNPQHRLFTKRGESRGLLRGGRNEAIKQSVTDYSTKGQKETEGPLQEISVILDPLIGIS